jgi:hypothetical protein
MLNIEIPPRYKKKGRALVQFPGGLSPEAMKAWRELRQLLPRTPQGNLQPNGLLLEYLLSDENSETKAVLRKFRELRRAARRAANIPPGRM